MSPMPDSLTACYFRVSTGRQNNENQKPDVLGVVARLGLRVAVTYEEQASAAKHRPEFERMMEDARAGRFKVLVVWALDRFGRSMQGNLRDVLELDRLGVAVVSVKEPWMDTGGPVRELLIAIFGWVAQQERARLIERTKAGMAVAKAAGKKIGRVSPTLDRSRADTVCAEWVKFRVGGLRELARRLGGCSPTTAGQVLKEWEKTQSAA